MPSGRVDLRSLGFLSGRGANWTLTVEGTIGRDAEDWRERRSEGCRQSSDKEGIEGVEAAGDDIGATSRGLSDLGIEGRGRTALDMWWGIIEYFVVELKIYGIGSS
jgi:hypothetical protein